jgi:hypothetical protein
VAIGEENLANVLSLKVHGTLNGYDVMVLRNKMVRLRNLDLGDATLVANDNGYQYYTGQSVQEGVFGAYFFDGCAKLQSIIFPKDITSIGYNALKGTNLSSVTIPEGVTTIGSYAFHSVSSLKNIIFPSTLKSIERYAFAYCYGLTELRLPPSVKTIDSYAFYYCSSLTEVRIPSSITSIGNSAFENCNSVKKVYTYTLEPTSINQKTFSTFTTATLYVPHQSYWTYWMNTQWSQFLTINEFNEPYEYFYLNGDYTLDDDTGTIDGNPDADLNDGSGLIVDGSDTQGLDDVNQNQNGDGTGSSIIGNDDGENTGNLDVNYLHIKITVSANKWYFFCFPFNVNVADCTYPGDYVWKEYKGLLRATTGKGWKTFDGNLLEAFHGYGFRTNKAGTLVITVQKPKFGGDRPATLLEYIAESIQDASWNLIGNAYSSYYNFTEQDFDAPFTVWNGSSYVAYRPGDDDYHLRPYEAFFTQKPSHADKVQFKAERRETHKQSQATAAQQAQRRRERGINPDRLLTNLFITDNDSAYVDRTRVVLNERASHDYEIECDAAKFLSTDAPAQLYTTGDNVQYAINERPAAGDIHLAYVAMKAGQLSIGAERMDQPMVLVDTEMGTTFDLSLGTYDFTTEAGTFEHRFLLRPASGVVTALADLRQQTGVLIGQQTGGIAIGGAEGKTVNVYTTDGALVASHNGNGFVALKHGIYVINVDGKTAKMPVR